MTTNWRANALCAQLVVAEPRWFEPFEAGEIGIHTENPLTHPRIAAAVSVCRRCPVRDRCLEVGLAGQEHGVWGGQYLAKKTPEKNRNRRVA